MARRFAGTAALALVLTLPLSACKDDSGLGVDTGKVSVLLTDAPGDFQAAVVTISKIYLQGDGGEVLLSDTKTTTDLLTLTNDVATLVDGGTVPAGVYTQLRLVITGGHIVVENEEGGASIYATAEDHGLLPGIEADGSLQLPSYGQSGLKIQLSGGGIEVGGEQQVLLVDFDVAQSFGQQAGASGTWVMSPVVKAAAIELSGDVAVTVRLGEAVTLPVVGDVQVTLGGFTAKLTNGGGSTEELVLTDEDGNGVFEAKFLYLVPGTYTLDIGAAAGVSGFATNPGLPLTVEVGSGLSVTKELMVTSAS